MNVAPKLAIESPPPQYRYDSSGGIRPLLSLDNHLEIDEEQILDFDLSCRGISPCLSLANHLNIYQSLLKRNRCCSKQLGESIASERLQALARLSTKRIRSHPLAIYHPVKCVPLARPSFVYLFIFKAGLTYHRAGQKRGLELRDQRLKDLVGR